MDAVATRLCHDPTPHNTREWLATLPLAAPERCSEQITEVLASLNGSYLPAKRRIELLEMVRGAVDVLLPALAHHSGAPVFPLDKAAQEQHLATLQLIRTLYSGYHAVSTPRRGLLGWPAERALTALAIQRCLHYGNWLLLLHRLSGRPANGLWLELHALFQLARTNRLSRRRVKDAVPGGRKASVESTYHRLLLTALTPLPEFESRWWEPLLKCLGDWSGLLRTSASAAPDAGGYFISPDSDSPPRPARGEETDGVFLDLSALSRYLDKTLARHRTGEAEIRLSRGRIRLPRYILARLHQHWSQAPGRSGSRQPLDKEVSITVGVGALHRALSPQQGSPEESADTEAPSLALEKSTESIRPGEIRVARTEKSDIWSSVYQQLDAPKRHWTETIDGYRGYRPLRVSTEDVSRDGAALCAPLDAIGALRFGDLVGLQSASGHWRAGTVCWISQTETHLRFGIRYLAFRCQPASVVVFREGKPHSRLPALAARDRDNRPVLILPSLDSLSAAPIQVQIGQRPQKVESTGVVFETHSYRAVTVPTLEID